MDTNPNPETPMDDQTSVIGPWQTTVNPDVTFTSQPTPSKFPGLSYEAEPQDDKPMLGLTPEDTPPMFDYNTLADRATRYSFALGDQPDPTTMYSNLKDGKEDAERQRAATLLQIQGRQVKNQLIQNILEGKGGQLTQDDIGSIMKLRDEEAVNPQTVMEKLYARRMTNQLLSQGLNPTTDTSTWQEAVSASPDHSYGLADAFENATAHNEIDNKLFEELHAKWKDSSYFTAIHQLGENLIPGLLWWQRQDAAANVSSFLPGNNIEDQREFLQGLPPDQYEQALRTAIKPMAEKNLTTALMYLSNIHAYSHNDKVLDNMMGVGDLSYGVTLPLEMAVRVARLGTGLAGIARARSLVKSLSASKVLDAGGNIPAAAHAAVIAAVTKRAATTNQSLTEMTKDAMSIFSIDKVMTGSDDLLSTVEAARLKDQLTNTATDLINNVLEGPVYVDRLTRDSTALQNAIDAATVQFKQLYNRANDAIISVSPVDASSNFNQDAIRIEMGKRPTVIATVQNAKKTKKSKTTGQQTVAVTMGTPQSELFDSAQAADRAAREDYGLRKYQVLQRGPGYYIQTYHMVDETAPSVRAAIMQDTNAKTPQGYFNNLFFNYLRSPDEKTGATLVNELKSIYGESMIVGSIKRALKPVGALSNDEYNKLALFSQRYQDTYNPTTQGRGVFADSVGQFYKMYYDMHKEMPSANQAGAYFAYRQVNDINYFNLNLGLAAQKTRKGLMNFELPYMQAPAIPNPMSTPVLDKVKSFTNKIEGKVLTHIPWDDRGTEPTAGVLVWDLDEKGMYKRTPFNFTDRDKTEKMIKEGGYTIISPTEIGERALRSTPGVAGNIPEGNLSIILAKEHNASPLDLKQLPYQPGGHVAYPHGWFISQPNIVISAQSKDKKGNPNAIDFDKMNQTRVSTYYGDKNFRSFETEKDVDQYLARYEKARQLLVEARTLRKSKQPGPAAVKEAELQKYLKANLPHSSAQFRNYFKQTGSGDDAIFDINTPFYKRFINESLENRNQLSRMTNAKGEAKYPNFRREQDSVFNHYKGLDTAMGMERSEPILTINNKGSVSNPVYKLEQARTLDPYVSMEQAASYLVRGRYLNDVKIKMAEQFVQEFGNLVPEISRDDQLADPIHTLISGSLKADGSAAYSAAKNYQITAKQFFNIKNEFDKERASFKRKALEGIFNNYSKDWGVAAEPWLMHRIPSAPSFLRSAVFHLKMLSPHQLSMQLSAVLHSMAIVGPKEAMIGTALSTYYRTAMFTRDEKMIAHLGKLAEQMTGMKAEHFIESLKGLQRSGMMYVGREVGQYTDHLDVGNVVSNTAGNILAGGRWFFNEGERISRMAAWAMSYREWRNANPTGVYNNSIIKANRTRADMLIGNMSSQSNARWQHGWAGVATQFWGYPVRVSEQFLGKRLTDQEKLRMFWTYGALYGYPQMGNLFMPLWPIADWTRGYDISRNVNPDTTTGDYGTIKGSLGDIAQNGLMSYMVEIMAGQRYNVNSRYGLGMSSISDMLDQAKGSMSSYDFFTGAGGTTTADVLSNMEPFGKAIISVFNKDGTDYPITAQDVNNFLTTSTMYSGFRKAWEAYNLGLYLTRSGKPVGPYSLSEAAMGILFGLQTGKVSDLFEMNKNEKAIKEAQNSAMGDIINKFHEGLEAGNDSDMHKYFKQAHILCVANAFTDAQCGQLMKRGIAGKSSVIEDIWKDIRSAPQERLDMWRSILKEGQP